MKISDRTLTLSAAIIAGMFFFFFRSYLGEGLAAWHSYKKQSAKFYEIIYALGGLVFVLSALIIIIFDIPLGGK